MKHLTQETMVITQQSSEKKPWSQNWEHRAKQQSWEVNHVFRKKVNSLSQTALSTTFKNRCWHILIFFFLFRSSAKYIKSHSRFEGNRNVSLLSAFDGEKEQKVHLLFRLKSLPTSGGTAWVTITFPFLGSHLWVLILNHGFGGFWGGDWWVLSGSSQMSSGVLSGDSLNSLLVVQCSGPRM